MSEPACTCYADTPQERRRKCRAPGSFGCVGGCGRRVPRCHRLAKPSGAYVCIDCDPARSDLGTVDPALPVGTRVRVIYQHDHLSHDVDAVGTISALDSCDASAPYLVTTLGNTWGGRDRWQSAESLEVVA